MHNCANPKDFRVYMFVFLNKNGNDTLLGTQTHDFALKNKLWQEASAS